MSEDRRCCGAGVCIIDAEGRCWCGQRWDGERMSRTAIELVPRDDTKTTGTSTADDLGR